MMLAGWISQYIVAVACGTVCYLCRFILSCVLNKQASCWLLYFGFSNGLECNSSWDWALSARQKRP